MSGRLHAHCYLPESAALAPLELMPANAADADAELSTFAKALAHPVRLRILRLLANRDARMCAEIVDELPLAQSTVSEHLRLLRAAGLVVAREDGIRTGYCLDQAAVKRLRVVLELVLPTPGGARNAP